MSEPDYGPPAWAIVSDKRRRHIVRVTELLAHWAHLLELSPEEAQCWIDAGRFHDALRDAAPEVLRAAVPDAGWSPEMAHGPAAAERLRTLGETRQELLDAVRYHTVGHAGWGRVGRALYLADFLEPGRKFDQAERALLAGRVVHDFDDVFRRVVRARIEWALREGRRLFPETVALWNTIA